MYIIIIIIKSCIGQLGCEQYEYDRMDAIQFENNQKQQVYKMTPTWCLRPLSRGLLSDFGPVLREWVTHTVRKVTDWARKPIESHTKGGLRWTTNSKCVKACNLFLKVRTGAIKQDKRNHSAGRTLLKKKDTEEDVGKHAFAAVWTRLILLCGLNKFLRVCIWNWVEYSRLVSHVRIK